MQGNLVRTCFSHFAIKDWDSACGKMAEKILSLERHVEASMH